MAKRKVLLYLVRDEGKYTSHEIWDHIPEWCELVDQFLSREDGCVKGRLLELCAEQEVLRVFGITLKPGQCKPIEIRMLPLVKAKELKP